MDDLNSTPPLCADAGTVRHRLTQLRHQDLDTFSKGVQPQMSNKHVSPVANRAICVVWHATCG